MDTPPREARRTDISLTPILTADHYHDHNHSHEIDPRDGLARGLLLVGVGLMLLTKVLEGSIPFYMHPRYAPLVGVTGVVLLALGVGHLVPAYRGMTARGQTITRSLALAGAPLLAAALWVHSPVVWAVVLVFIALPVVWLLRQQGLARHFGLSGLLLALPVVLGLLVVSEPLGTAALESKNVVNQAQASAAPRWTIRDASDTSDWTLVNWTTALWQGDSPTALDGKPVDVVGFIYRPKDANGTVHVARFVVTCCTADSSGVSLPVQSPQVDSLDSDTWVRIQGTLRFVDSPRGREPTVEASQVTTVDRPAMPYLYP